MLDLAQHTRHLVVCRLWILFFLGRSHQAFNVSIVLVVADGAVQEILGSQGVDDEVLHGSEPQGDAGLDTIDVDDGGVLFARSRHCVKQGS